MLSLPRIEDCSALDQNLWNPSSQRLALNTWFTVGIHQIRQSINYNVDYLSSKQFLWKEIENCVERKKYLDKIEEERKNEKRQSNWKKKRKLEVDDDTKEEIEEERKLKAKRIELFPNERQRNILKRWFGTARWTYNQCLDAIKTKKARISLKELRTKFVVKSGISKDKSWVLDTPSQVRDEAVRDLLKNFRSNFAKVKEHGFTMKFKSKKEDKDSIVIRVQDYRGCTKEVLDALRKRKRGKWIKKKKGYGPKKGKKNEKKIRPGRYVVKWMKKRRWKGGAYLCPKHFGNQPIESSEPLPQILPGDSRLIRTRLNQYFLCIPQPLEIQPERQRLDYLQGGKKIIALDPGVRTFNTGYDLEGNAFEWGKSDIERIFKLCHRQDRLQSEWSKEEVKHRKRYKLRRAARKIRKKIRNIVDEVHCKMIKWLCENYDIILLTLFETQRMVRKWKRKIGKETTRKLEFVKETKV